MDIHSSARSGQAHSVIGNVHRRTPTSDRKTRPMDQKSEALLDRLPSCRADPIFANCIDSRARGTNSWGCLEECDADQVQLASSTQ